MSNSDEEEFIGTPSEISEIANEASLNLLPNKSRKQYEICYNRFKEWCFDKNVRNYTENVLLAYFLKRSKDIEPSTLWSEYSMVRAYLCSKESIDIKTYKKVMAFMKQNSVGFRPKKSKVFTRDHIYKFLKEAPDSQYLMKKVAAIFGIAGACRREELQKLNIDDIEEVNSILIVKVPRSKTDKERSFVIRDTGANILELKKHGGWKSSTVAEGYVEESQANLMLLNKYFSLKIMKMYKFQVLVVHLKKLQIKKYN